METQSGHKDTELTSFRPGRGQAIINFFMGIGFFIGFIILLSVISIGVYSWVEGVSFTEALNGNSSSSINNSTTGLRILNLFSSALPLILASWLTIRISFKGKMEALYGNRLKFNSTLFLSFLFLIVFLPLVAVLLGINSKLDLSFISEGLQQWIISSESQNNALYEIIAGEGKLSDVVINLLLMAAIPALAEELFFRGLLLKIFRSWFKNPHLGIWTSALIFAVIHMQFLKVLPMLCLGAAFGYMVYWTGSIWPAVIAHFINNAFAVFALHYSEGNYEEVLGQQSDLPLGFALVLTGILIALFYYLQKNAHPKLNDPYA